MKFNEIVTSRNKQAKRVGRGISAGRGKTAGRGTKGQGSRKSTVRHGFSGGQTPLHMQLPKLRGFKSKKVPAENVYTGQLDMVKKAVVDNNALFEAGLISSPFVNVKLIRKGELKAKKTVKVQSASAGAVSVVETAGGTVDITARQAREKTSKKLAK